MPCYRCMSSCFESAINYSDHSSRRLVETVSAKEKYKIKWNNNKIQKKEQSLKLSGLFVGRIGFERNAEIDLIFIGLNESKQKSFV